MQRTTNYESIAVSILNRIRYATVATVSMKGLPWNSPVSFVYDEDLRLYWFSDRASQHSRNIRHTGVVFIVIYDSTLPEGSGAKGLYMYAKATEVEDPSLVRHARYLKDGEPRPDDMRAFLGADSIRRVYQATPMQLWMNDVERTKDGVFIRDYRIELSVARICHELSKLHVE